MIYATKITGTGSAYPAKRVTNGDLTKRLAELDVQTSDKWIQARTGIQERRYSDLSNPKESNASLAATAAMRALEMAGKTALDVDQIIVATCSPETNLPSIACFVQRDIGAVNSWAMDINAACSGFVYGLVTASQFINTDQIRTALVIGSEVLHPYLNWYDRSSCILFGDAAGAAVIEQVPVNNESKILNWYLSSDGRYANHLHIPACCPQDGDDDSCQEKNHETGHIVMNGREIFKLAVRRLTKMALTVTDKEGLSIKDLDWLVPHQANQRILEAVAQRLEIPIEKVLVNLDRFGNTSSATIPTVLDEAVRQGRIKSGQTLLLDAFGAGFTYGAMLVRW
ncbi:MAG: ketoacyl-ACP synthase III [Desulfobacteraceae bacterium]|nr:ketoacyl-ACP synthase III [Desulfobacteraceae bacterium]